MQDVFLLGCERSGSTWLANIFDAHPCSELLMEPFADYVKFFPDVADRNTYDTGANAERCVAVRTAYERIVAAKYPFLYRPGRPVLIRRIEQVAAKWIRRETRRILGRETLAQQRHHLLQLNALETPVQQLTRKQREPRVRLTKELRLNFKVGLLRASFPDARFIVIVRHPAAQIASIMQWMNRGRLRELARAIDDFQFRTSEQERFKEFDLALARSTSEEPLESKLARWWACNYSVLLNDLAASGADHLVVRHERIAMLPEIEIGKLLDFAGLDRDAAVERYVAWSSRTDPTLGASIETVRNSASHARDAIRSAPAHVMLAVEQVLCRLERAGLLADGLADGFESVAV